MLVISRTRTARTRHVRLERGEPDRRVGAPSCYLLFLALWGLNYRRVPLEQKLDYERSRGDARGRASALGRHRASREVNAATRAAHAPRCRRDVARARRLLTRSSRLGAIGPPCRRAEAVAARAATSARAAIDGMTDPFFLEIIINPDVLPFERPFVLAHEWAHLAGYANEAEANFVAWLTCIRGDAARAVQRMARRIRTCARRACRGRSRDAHSRSTPGRVEDLRAMAARYARSSPLVRRAAHGVYDEYLQGERVQRRDRELRRGRQADGRDADSRTDGRRRPR